MGRVSDAAQYLVPLGPFSLFSHALILSSSPARCLAGFSSPHGGNSITLSWLPTLRFCPISAFSFHSLYKPESGGKGRTVSWGQSHLCRDFSYIILPRFNAWTSHMLPNLIWMRTEGLHQFESSPGAFWASFTVRMQILLFFFFWVVTAVSVFIL